MFSGINGLGERQAELPEWYGMDDQNEGDIDFISTNFYSPDAGYPPDRMELYDAELEQPVTLNGVGVAPYRGSARQMRVPHFRVMAASRPATGGRSMNPGRFSGRIYNPQTRSYSSR